MKKKNSTAPTTSPSPLSDEELQGWGIFSYEFLKAEIARLEPEVHRLRQLYDEAVLQQVANTASGVCRKYYLDYNDPTRVAFDQAKAGLEKWKWELARKTQTDFIKRVTTFPKEIELNDRDMRFMAACDFAASVHDIGFTKTAILDGMKEAMKPQPNWCDELIDEEIAVAIRANEQHEMQIQVSQKWAEERQKARSSVVKKK
jgi:hypothetical protein